MGELITVHDYWGNHVGISKLGKLYSTGRLIVCEPYSFEGEDMEENANTPETYFAQ
ncbi:hypothetical protein HNQ85_000247 [Anoxybacillus calidus]|jgi:hypothetical protein|uniref:Uncharacterized protein n=1 Tax=[Anoxybacillus] calidus TaxID=575178 RepID=A0A7V9YX04_9BACL|nr:hypothetical protein [Anoxybacillus calidus]MBA2869989.1 hypothetical protein [Anoxybacillus calidus]